MTELTPINGPLPSLIPEGAPFTGEQRAWLNGFFSGFIAMEKAAASAVAHIPLPAASPDAGDDGEPWHDQSLSLAGRMALAESRPLPRRLMAAMAQQDCGQCGYDCRKYADAIAARTEARLNLCVPGGKETARMLKTLAAELDGGAIAAPALIPPPETAPGTSRENPAGVTFLGRRRLNKPGSEKDTWHIELDISAAGLSYTVGNSFGIYPENSPALVAEVLAALGVSANDERGGRRLGDCLRTDVSLGAAPDTLFQLFSYVTGGARRQLAKALAAGDDPDGDAATLDVLGALRKFAGVRPDAEAVLEALDPLQPRLYSISSSPKAAPGRLSLTVDAVRYTAGGRKRLGAASTFLAERVQPGAVIKAYVQKAHNFALPADPSTPIIMVGPGTGIAPFRAFLQERAAIAAPGRNWLFFGHQRSACDFFYEDELTDMKAGGVLTRLSLAWSRDGDGKFYVQDRMREVARDIWAWLEDGAHFYVCGDAKRMAKDVDRALADIAAAEGKMSADAAVAFIAGLKKAGRYQADIY